MKMFRLLRLVAVLLLLAVATIDKAHGDEPTPQAQGNEEDCQEQLIKAATLMALADMMNTQRIPHLTRIMVRNKAAPPKPNDVFAIRMKKWLVKDKPKLVKRQDGTFYIRMIKEG